MNTEATGTIRNTDRPIIATSTKPDSSQVRNPISPKYGRTT